MTWLFSKAMMEAYGNSPCSQALAAEYSEGTSLAGEQFAQLNVMPTPHKFWRNDKTMEFSSLSRFGLTLRLLTESHGEELLMSFLAGFHARTLVWQEGGREFPDPEAECGKKWRGLLAKYDPDTCSWKTAQCSLLEDLEQSLETWPRWGSMRNGECYQLLMPGHLICEKEYGFWPTPTHSPRDASCTMETAIKWDGIAKQDSLSFTVAREEKAEGRHIPHGHLNPEWVEWLMGWPIGWTDLKPLAMDKFQEWQQQHSLYFQNEQDSNDKEVA